MAIINMMMILMGCRWQATIGCGIGATNCAQHIENQNAVCAKSFAFTCLGLHSSATSYYWVPGGKWVDRTYHLREANRDHLREPNRGEIHLWSQKSSQDKATLRIYRYAANSKYEWDHTCTFYFYFVYTSLVHFREPSIIMVHYLVHHMGKPACLD